GFREDKMQSVALAAAVLVCAAFAPAAHAEWPDHPIHWVVPFGPGGANDLIARVAAEAASKKLGQTIVIDNRPGATTGTQTVARATPDGYTFLIGAAGVITNSLLLKNLPYQDSDLVPVGMIAVAPSIIVVNPSVPASNMTEFIAWAKTQGDKGITWSTAGSGSTPHFVAEMFKEATGVNITIVPYRSGNDGGNAVLSNSASVTSEASIVALAQMQAGRRAPRGTPEPIIARMNEALQAVNTSEVRAKLGESGIETAAGSVADFT